MQSEEQRLLAEAALEAQIDAEIAARFSRGELDWMLLKHQADDYRDFRRWNVERQTEEHLDWVAEIEALYDNLWVDECGRRYGKTAKWLITDVEECIRRPNTRGLIACAFQKNIGEIIVPLCDMLFRDAPLGYKPQYHGTKGAEHECLVIPATNSIIKLVGLDLHPDAARGQWLDFAHISEAAFVRGLKNLIESTIMPLFQGRPWAYLVMESSTAKVRDCEFNTEFREDAKKRGTYRRHTIRENTTLTEKEIAKEERRSGGAKSVNCRRELYCEETREPTLMVVPEFDAPTPEHRWTRHIKPPGEVPKYAHTYVAMDPGEGDPLGLVWGFYDFLRAKLVIQKSFARSNFRTGQAAALIKEVERELWGTAHRDIPQTMRRDDAIRAQPMLTIADALVTPGGRVWTPPQFALTYWDRAADSFKPNPFRRISDIDARMVGDLAVEHSITFEKTAKDDAYAQEAALRHAFDMDWIEIWEENGDLHRQLESGMWQLDGNGRRRDWLRTPTLGHLDCIAALIYLWRNLSRELNPHPPARIETALHDVAIPLGVDHDTAIGRGYDVSDSRFRQSSGEKNWR